MMDNVENKPWYDVLLAARRLEKRQKDGWTSTELAKEALIEATPRSTEIAIASAWCGKLYRWGYVLPVGISSVGAGRPSNVYRLTAWGREFRTDVKAEAPKKKASPPTLKMVPREKPKLRIAANPPKED